MAVIVSAPEGQNFTQIETGTYQSVCAEVCDLGERETKDFNTGEMKMVHKVAIIWELSEERDDGKKFTFSREYKASLHEKSALRKDLDAWRGVAFTAEELKGFDLENVKGANCMITIGSYVKGNGDEGRKVTAVSKLMKGLEKMTTSEAYQRPKWIDEIVNPTGQTAGDDDLPF